MYNEGKDTKYIIGELSAKFRVSPSTIKRYTSDLVANGIIQREQDVRIANRRADVLNLYETMNQGDMARKLGVSEATIDTDIRALKQQGLIKKGRSRIILPLELQERIRERRERFESIYNGSKVKPTVVQMAYSLGVSYAIAYRDFKILKKLGRLKDFDKENVKEESKPQNERSPEIGKSIKKIIDLYKQGNISEAKELLRKLR